MIAAICKAMRMLICFKEWAVLIQRILQISRVVGGGVLFGFGYTEQRHPPPRVFPNIPES